MKADNLHLVGTDVNLGRVLKKKTYLNKTSPIQSKHYQETLLLDQTGSPTY
jgi:hypothetical protein